METPTPRLIGAVEAAKRLGIGRRTLNRYTQEGKVKAHSILPSGFYRYQADYIDALAAEWETEYPEEKTA